MLLGLQLLLQCLQDGILESLLAAQSSTKVVMPLSLLIHSMGCYLAVDMLSRIVVASEALKSLCVGATYIASVIEG
jgi:esterase/lipase superfamily enzyme